jgi:hypothetical protein
VLLLSAPPAVAAVRSSASPSSAQGVASGAWRLIFSTSSTPAASSGTVTGLKENTTNYVYLVNTSGNPLPTGYQVTATATSVGDNNASLTLTACVGGTWTSSTSCSGTSVALPTTTFPLSTLAPAGSSTVPGGWSVQVKVANTAFLGNMSSGTASLSVTLASV